MLMDYDPGRPLYLIGSGIVVQSIRYWLTQDSNLDVRLIEPDQFSDLPPGSQCMLGFWTNHYRKKFIESQNVYQYSWPTYVHNDASINTTETLLGRGTVIYPLAFVGYQVRLGDFGLVGQMSSVGHGARLGINNTVGPGSIIGGSTEIGDHVAIGQASSIKDKITIAGNTKLFMNSVVSKPIVEPGVYFGNKKVPQQVDTDDN